MGPHYRSDFIGADVGAGCSIAMNETPRRSPRILITRACSEDSQDGGSPMLRKPFLVNALPCDSVYLYFSKFFFFRYFSTRTFDDTRSILLILYFCISMRKRKSFLLLLRERDLRFTCRVEQNEDGGIAVPEATAARAAVRPVYGRLASRRNSPRPMLRVHRTCGLHREDSFVEKI